MDDSLEDTAEDNKLNISFVDILFALVIGQALTALSRYDYIPEWGRSHLLWASLLVILSWIGYHRSEHRFAGDITFDLGSGRQLAGLGKFAVDIFLVVLYWIAVRTTEGGFVGSSSIPSWHPEMVITIAAFCLYAIWDLLSWVGRETRPTYFSWRRNVTLWFVGVSIVVATYVVALNPKSGVGVEVVDLVLISVLVAYRVAKDTQPESASMTRAN